MSEGRLRLSAGSSIATVAPGVGGSIASWQVDGQPMLRSATAGTRADPLGMASFPLVPYSNRIPGGRVTHDGDVHVVARTLAGEADPIHGVGLLRAWHVASVDTTSACLTLTHRGDACWPWPFTAHQCITVTPDGLTLDLRMINDADGPAPAAFGHHPYFERDGAILAFRAAQVWRDGGAQSISGPFDFADGAAVGPSAIDHCYTGWDGHATIRWPGRRHALDITASATLPAAVLYIPAGQAFFCFEPVPHRNHAPALPGQGSAPMPVVDPGRSFTASIRLRVISPA